MAREERIFRISACPSCEAGKDTCVVWNPETGKVIVNHQEQAEDYKSERWEVEEDHKENMVFYGYCGAINKGTEDGEEIFDCEEPFCLEFYRNSDGTIAGVDLEFFHDDSEFVEYFEVMEDGSEVKISDSHDHPVLVYDPLHPELGWVKKQK